MGVSWSMKYSDRPKEPIGSKQMLYCLTQVRPAMEKMHQMGKEYGPLLAALLELAPEAKIPTAKALQQQLNISPAVFKRWLETWHSDFLGLIEQDADVLQFKEVEYLFCVPGRRDYVTFLCRLAISPQVGEAVEVPFVSGVTGSGVYHVDSVSHEYRHDKTQIVIQLREGYYDPYVRHLRHRARFEKTLTWEAESELSSYETQARLRELYGQPERPQPRPAVVPSEPRRRHW